MRTHTSIPALSLVGSLALALLAFEASAGAAPPVQSPAQPRDEVRLTNGGFIKGEVLELIPGEYVLLKTLAGEIRRFVWAEVASVQHGDTTISGSTPQPQPQPPIAPEPEPEPPAAEDPPADIEGPTLERPYIHIDVDGKHPLTLQRVTGRAVAYGSGGSATGVSFTRVCESPCDLLVPNSGDEFFFSSDKYTGSRAFQLGTSSSVYELRVKPRAKGLLIGGYVMLVTAPTIAGILAILPVVVNMRRSDATATWALAGVGGALLLGGGITMMAFGRTKVEVLPRDRTWLEGH